MSFNPRNDETGTRGEVKPGDETGGGRPYSYLTGLLQKGNYRKIKTLVKKDRFDPLRKLARKGKFGQIKRQLGVDELGKLRGFLLGKKGKGKRPVATDITAGDSTNQNISLTGLVGLLPSNKSNVSTNFRKNLRKNNFGQLAPSLIGGN